MVRFAYQPAAWDIEDPEFAPPSLQELARDLGQLGRKFATERQTTNALELAGLDPNDRNERARFQRLVRASAEFCEQEVAATLEPYYARACERLGDDETFRHRMELAVAIGCRH
jgi:hypothetical protein